MACSGRKGSSDAGETTYTLNVGPLPVQAGMQAVYCTNVHLGNPEPIDVVGFTSTQTLGGHHLILLSYKTDQPDSPPTPCDQSTAVDPRNGSMIYISQIQQDSQSFPAGVGMTLPANASLMLQVHYIDATVQDLQVSTTVNVIAAAAGSTTQTAAPLLFYDANISVPPGQSTATASCTMQNDHALFFFMLAGHMHSHGTNFVLDYTNSQGQTTQIYQTSQWDSPQEKDFDPPLVVRPTNVFTWSCDYTNNTGATIDGPNEMCAILGNYYPADQGSMSCFAAGTSLCDCFYGGGLPDAGL